MNDKTYQNPNRSKYADLRKEHTKYSKFPQSILFKGKKEDLENELRMLIYDDINSFNVDEELLTDEFYRYWMSFVINFKLDKITTKMKDNVNISCIMEFIDTLSPTTDKHTKHLEDEMRQKILFNIDENDYSKLSEMKNIIDEYKNDHSK